jgi:hypothetical protein
LLSEAAFPIGELAESGNWHKAILAIAQIDPPIVEAIEPVRAYGRPWGVEEAPRR